MISSNSFKSILAIASGVLYLANKVGGIVPNDMESLQSLPGVGRKSANVIMLDVFHNPQGIAVDTHAKARTFSENENCPCL